MAASSKASIQSATLSEDDPKISKRLFGWFYLGTIELPKLTNWPVTLFVKLFGVAEKYKMTRLADDAMDVLLNVYSEKKLSSRTAPEVDSRQITHADSKIWVFLVRLFIYLALHEHSEGSNPQIDWTGENMHESMKEIAFQLLV